MKKKKTVDQELIAYRDDIVSEIERWKDISKNGCSDPFWQDGINMNLVRNHILYFKRKISEICEENDITLPSEYFLPTPPVVENSYMANLSQKSRVEKLRKSGQKITTNKVRYSKQQLCFL